MMTLSASPALVQVETALKVSPGSFANNNYRSVFDIARMSRKQFIAANISWLGLRGGKAWDLAVGQAQYMRRLFREKQLTRQIRQSLTQTLSGPQAVSSRSADNVQGLVQDGPTWRNQFAENWQAYCQSGAPEANDSPVSYLTWLYKQALTYEQEINASSTADQVLTLAERRPDLATLTIDNEAINQQIPALQLVNEILEESIATVLPADQSVDGTLAETRYPTLLPYHFPHDQVELALQNASVPLEKIVGQTATDWPWFLNDSWQGARSNTSTELASRLAPEQQALVTEADNSTASDLITFYKTNLGLNTADYTPFADPDTFTYQLGIVVPQVEELVAGSVGGTSVVVSPNTISEHTDRSFQCLYGASFINGYADPAVFLNEPVSPGLIFSNTEYVEGKFGQGIQTRSTDNSYFYFQPDGDMAQAMKGDKSFTLGFWVNRLHYDARCVPLVTNGGDNYDWAYSSGHSFSLASDNTSEMALADKNGKVSTSGWHSNFPTGVWCYVALVWNATTKKAQWYKYGSDGSKYNYPVEGSALDDITTAPGFTWAFNVRGDLTHDRAATEDTPNFIYDDIAVFNGALTAENINTLANSGKPVTETDISGFAASCIWISSLNPGIQNLSDARMDRINRMVRLQRWLGLSYEETDLLLSACIRAQGTNNTDFTLNAHTLRTLGVFRHWQQKYGVTAFEFAAVLDEITPYAISPAVPFLDQVFNSPSLFDEPFAITGETVNYTAVTGDSARTVRQICAGLGITQAQFRVLADRVAAEQGDANAKTFPLTLAVVSALYRLAMVPRWLGLSFADGAALLSLAGEGDAAWTRLAGVPQLAALTDGHPVGGDILDLLMALDAAAEWATEHKLSWVKSYLALQPETDALEATSATVNFVNGIKQQLPAALLSEQSFNGMQQPGYSRCLNIQNGSTHDDSPLGKGHGFKLDSTQGQYATFTDTANSLTNGNASYTTGMWVKVTSGASVNFPVLANAAAYNEAASPGIFISLGSGYHLNISVASNDADLPLVLDTSKTSWQADKWFWLAIVTDTTQQTVTVYAWSEDGSIKSSASLSYKGSILPEEGNGWAISQNGTLNDSGNKGIISYDDITIWNRALTADDVAEIVSSGKPATQTLPATLVNNNFLSDLIDNNGLVLPVATDYSTITAMVTADIDAAGITFASDADREQAISSLSGIINQARLTQNGIADSALAQMFSTAQSLPPLLLSWAGDSEYRLLSDSLAMNNGAALTNPSQVPASYLTDLFALGQRAGISTAFTLTPAALAVFLAHPDWFGVSDTTLTLTLLYRLSRYGDWLAVAGDEDRVLAYLSRVNGATPPDATQAAAALALLLAWESSEVADATAALPGGLAKSVTDVDYVMRLQQLSAETGLSVTPLLATGELVPGGVTGTWDAWQSAGESLVAAQTGQQ